MTGGGTGGRTRVPELRAFGVVGLGEVRAGDDLAAALLTALEEQGERLQDGDLLVVSSKIVSKSEGRSVRAGTRAQLDASAEVASESLRLVARRRTPVGLARVVEAAAGPVMAAAGVDVSNVEPGTALLLPKDPDGSARALRASLRGSGGSGGSDGSGGSGGSDGSDGLGGPVIGVLLSDTAGRAWRDGQTDFALGAAGVRVVDDLRGAVDGLGNPLEVTVRALADEVAALADLVKGKLSGIPAAVVRGLPDLVTDDDGPGAAVLLRTARQDWFRLGHVEAVRAALGVDPEQHEPPTVPAGSVAERLGRAVLVALAAPDPWDGATGAGAPSWDGDHLTVHLPPDAGPARLGALAQRLAMTAWSEDLTLDIRLHGTSLGVRASEAG